MLRSRAVVLHVLKYNDDTLIADAYTEARGRVSFLLRVSRSPRAAVRHTLFQPLSLLSLEWNHRPSASLQRLRQARVAFPFSSLPYDARKSAVALFLAEFLHHVLRAEPEAASLYRYVEASVEWLDTSRKGFANFHLAFMLRLARFLGFSPNVEGYFPGAAFDLEAGCFALPAPGASHCVPPADAARLPQLMRMSYETMRLFRFSGAERGRLLGYINEFYSLHVPGFPPLKSLPVLTDVFNA